MALVQQDLGRNVLGRAAEREGAVLNRLGEAEIRDLQVARAVDQQVLRAPGRAGNAGRKEEAGKETQDVRVSE